MSLSAPAKIRLVKLLALTTSNHDGEALAAIRKANELLLQYDLAWQELFEEDETEDVPVKRQRGRPHSALGLDWDSEALRKAVAAAFDELLGNTQLKGGFRDFIEDVRAQWAKRRWLTDKQYTAIMAAAKRQYSRRAAE